MPSYFSDHVARLVQFCTQHWAGVIT